MVDEQSAYDVAKKNLSACKFEDGSVVKANASKSLIKMNLVIQNRIYYFLVSALLSLSDIRAASSKVI